MAKVIIGIHGLGNKPEKHLLEEWWRLSVEEGLRARGYKGMIPHLVIAYWADLIYEKPLDLSITDPDDPLYIDEPYAKTPENFREEDHSTRLKIIDFIGKQLNKLFLNDDLTLNHSSISDKIIKNYFSDLEFYYNGSIELPDGRQARARDIIRTRLSDIISNHRRDEILLVAHSMGSIIAYDTLSLLSPRYRIDTFVTIGSPLGLPVIIGKIAAEMKLRPVKGFRPPTPDNITRSWYNLADILDKIAFNFRLSDDFGPNSFGISPVDFLITNDYVYGGRANPHKSFGYLRSKEFAGIISEFMQQRKVTIIDRLTKKISNLIIKLRNHERLQGNQ